MEFKTLLKSAAALLAVFPLWCRATAAEVAPVPLKLYELPDPKSSSPFVQADIEVIKAFKKRHPHIELSSFSGISIAGHQWDSQALLAIAGGSAPDVLYVNFRQSDTYIARRFLYPLDKFIRRDFKTELKTISETAGPEGGYDDAVRKMLGANGVKRIATPIWPVVQRRGPAVLDNPAGVHIWAMPWNIEVRALFYRKDLFIYAGLNPDQPPRDWNELYECAKRIHDPARRRYGIELASGDSLAWDFMPFLWSAGGEAVRLVNDEWVAAYNSPAAVTALDFYLKLTSEAWLDADGNIQRGYAVHPSKMGGGSGWEAGRVGMRAGYLDDKTIAGDIDPALVGIAPLPIGPAGLRGAEINCSMMGIFSGIADRRNSAGEYVSAEAIRQAAWDYIWFFGSEAAQRIRIDKLVDMGYGRMLNPDLLVRFGYGDLDRLANRDWVEIFNQAIKDGHPEPYGKNCQMIYAYMAKPIERGEEMARRGGFLIKKKTARAAILKRLLDKAVKRTNEKMLDRLAPGERMFRNRVAGVAACLVLAIFCLVIYKVWRMFSPPEPLTGQRGGWQFRRYGAAYLIILPAVGSMVAWFYLPLIMGSSIICQNYSLMGESSFVGLKNIADVLYSAEWWRALWNTFRYMAMLLGLGFFLPIILAILLQEAPRGRLAYRIIYYLPALMSGLVVVYMWKLFFHGDSTGLVNQLVAGAAAQFGLHPEPVKWLKDSNWAMLCCVIPVIWAGTGPGCLIYLAALKGVPDELYEAADIDGASFLHKIRHITLPSMKTLIIINFIGAFINASVNSGMILVMTYGHANTEVAGLHIFKEAYTRLNFGMAISMAWILGITLIGFTVLQLRGLSRMEFTAGRGLGRGDA